MKDKEIVEKYLTSIKDELMMYSDALSEKNLSYIDNLKKNYSCWEKDLDKINGLYKEENYAEEGNKDEDKIKDSYIDESLEDAIDEYSAYLGYKKEYLKTNNKDKLDMSYQELGHFLTNLYDVFKELDEYSKDEVEERAMIKSKVKEYYQLFG